MEPETEDPSYPTDLLFSEPTAEAEVIPLPKLFVDVVQRQWTAPLAGPNPTSVDRRFYSVDLDLAWVLQTPTVDAPVAVLQPLSPMPGEPEGNLKPEDRRTEQTLQKAHQAAVSAVRASTTTSFFNQESLLWLCQRGSWRQM